MFIDHVSVGVDDLAAARKIYDGAMEAIGFKPLHELGDFAVAYGIEFPCLWVQKPIDQKPASSGNGTHVCLRAQSKEGVDAFHAAGLAGGGTDDGAPGYRKEYAPNYYAAFIKDTVGNKIEAVFYDEVKDD